MPRRSARATPTRLRRCGPPAIIGNDGEVGVPGQRKGAAGSGPPPCPRPPGARALEQSARKLGCLYPHGRAEVSMAGSYSTDLRERVLAAVEAGATPETAARRFAV